MALTPGQIMSTLTAGGLTKTAAAGVAGNLMQESSDNPAESGGGLAQWQGDRYSGLVKYSQARGLAPTSGTAALGYLMQDLNGAYSGLKGHLNNARSAAEAATLFSDIYERPGTPMLGNRVRYANQALGATGSPVTGGQPAGQTGGLPALPGARSRQVTTHSFDQGAYNAAVANSIAGQYVAGQSKATDPYASLQGKTGLSTGAASNPLLLSGQLRTTAPRPSDYMTAHTTLQKIAGTGLNAHPVGNDAAVATQAVNDAKATGADPAAQKMLRMIHAVLGGSYSQGNHDAINENQGQVRARGTDCSGLISWLMGPQGLGVWRTSLATPDIANAPGLQAGRGGAITIWNNKQAGNAGHVFIQIGNQFFASEGGVGIRQLPVSEVRNYIQHGSDGGTYQPLHPKGL